MTPTPPKAWFLSRLVDAHRQLDALLSGASPEQLLAKGGSGWSAGDLLAHITWYEREMVGLLEARILAGSSLWNLSPDERNAEIYQKVKNFSPERVLADYRRVASALLEAAAVLEEADLLDSNRYRRMPAGWVPWRVLADNTFDHISEHVEELAALLERDSLA